MAATKLDFNVEELKESTSLKHLPVIAKYDEGLKQLLSQVFAGSVILAPVDRAFELYVNQENDKIHFPFISIFPSGGYNVVNKNFAASNIGHPVFRSGITYNDDTLEKTGTSKTMQNFYQLLYYDIPYSIDCWSTNRIEALQLVQELMFWLTSQRQVLINYKNNKYTANLTISDNILDSTSYTNYSDLGSIYRFTININIEAPVFRTQNYLNITKSELEVSIKDDESLEEEENQ